MGFKALRRDARSARISRVTAAFSETLAVVSRDLGPLRSTTSAPVRRPSRACLDDLVPVQ
jgi:hypothetical protein